MTTICDSTGKPSYPQKCDAFDAAFAVKRLRATRRPHRREPWTVTRTYRCGSCGGWHYEFVPSQIPTF